MIRLAMCGALALAACNAGEDVDASRVQLGDVDFLAPPSWQVQARGATTRVWTPEDNRRRESVTVMIGPRYLGGAERAFAAARRAQDVLRDARVTAEERFTTPSGLPAVRLVVKFRPDAVAAAVYERTHVVLFVADPAGDHTVHVLYTAAAPDPERAALARVVASIAKGA